MKAEAEIRETSSGSAELTDLGPKGKSIMNIAENRRFAAFPQGTSVVQLCDTEDEILSREFQPPR
jgi:hypothetical protein